jgi:hypothetical protein
MALFDGNHVDVVELISMQRVLLQNRSRRQARYHFMVRTGCPWHAYRLWLRRPICPATRSRPELEKLIGQKPSRFKYSNILSVRRFLRANLSDSTLASFPRLLMAKY